MSNGIEYINENSFGRKITIQRLTKAETHGKLIEN